MTERQRVINHFKYQDKAIYLIAKKKWPLKELKADEPKNYFYRLCKEIIGQQLAGTVVKVIFSRFEKLFSKNEITPRKLLNISHKTMREIGLSNAKAKYVKNLAKAVVDKKLQFENFKNLSNEEIMAQLTKVKGIGPWTAEMFLMFTMAREDVFSAGDLGLRKAIKKIYKFEEMPNIKSIQEISNKWKPFRTYASLILWES